MLPKLKVVYMNCVIISIIYSYSLYVILASATSQTHVFCLLCTLQASDQASLKALENLMSEFFDGRTTNERKRNIGMCTFWGASSSSES
jgi:hypothetical protein